MTKKNICNLLIACGLFLSVKLVAQSNTVAGIPVNYEESETGDYRQTLPDPLVMQNGKPVRSPKEWYKKRRPEIVRLFEENQYGKWPEKPKLRYDVQEDTGLDGVAVRKQVTLYFSPDNEGPKLDVLIYLPKDAKGPVPILLNISFFSNNMTLGEAGIKDGTAWNPKTKERMPVVTNERFKGFGMNERVKTFLHEGFGFATMNYTDIEPDFEGGVSLGVRALYLKPGQKEPAADEWGAISAWAWGISTVVDYFEKDASIDAKRVAITGTSRLGKTVMWAGARDERIAMVIASCSGEGGAALSRRIYGETVGHLTAPGRFSYQFAANYGKYGSDVTKLPVDANMLIALIAPRPLLLQTGLTDKWSDPKGEFLAAVEAGKVYRFLGKDDLCTSVYPEPDQPIYHTLGYFMHDGKHAVLPADWDVYLEFMKRYL